MSSPEEPKRILLAEDSLVQRMSLHAMLEAHGYQVDEAENGEQALRQLESSKRPPDLVITDIGMPHMNGINLCRRIKQNPRTWHVPVIMLTSLGNERNHRTGIEAGATEFVTKPVGEQELLYRVALALAGAAESHEAQRSWHGVVLDALPDGVLVTDERGCYIDGNTAFLQCAAYSREEMKSLARETLILEPKNWAQAVPEAISSGGVWQGQVKLKGSSGTVGPMAARTTSAALGQRPTYVWLLTASTAGEAGRSAKEEGGLSSLKPEDLIDATRLHEMIGLRSSDPGVLTAEEYDRLVKFTAAVSNAAAVKRIRRFVKKDAANRVTGRLYVRAELERIIRNRG